MSTYTTALKRFDRAMHEFSARPNAWSYCVLRRAWHALKAARDEHGRRMVTRAK